MDNTEDLFTEEELYELFNSSDEDFEEENSLFGYQDEELKELFDSLDEFDVFEQIDWEDEKGVEMVNGEAR